MVSHFCLVGSWDGWRHFTELRPVTPLTPTSVVATVPVRRPPSVEEITALPAECMQLEILWDSTARRVSWKLLDVKGLELAAKAGAARSRKKKEILTPWLQFTAQHLTGPFFLVGSWDDWTGFTELWHCGAGVFRGAVHMETQTSQTQREASVQFQVLRGRDWAQRFHPDEAGDGLAGPDGQHGLNWHAKLKERWLEVTWPHLSWCSSSALARHRAGAAHFVELMRQLQSEGIAAWLEGMEKIFAKLPDLQRSSPYGKKAEQDATARCLLATALRDLDTMAALQGPACDEQRKALSSLESNASKLLVDSGVHLSGPDFMQEALPVGQGHLPVQLKPWHRLVYLPLVMYVRNTVHLYELLERLKAQAVGLKSSSELRELLDAKKTARESPYSWLVFSILGALQTLYQVRSRCPGLLEFLASSPPQTLWVKDGVEWTPSAGHEGFQRKAIPNPEPMKPLGSFANSLMYRGIWLPSNTDEDILRYQYSFQSFSRSLEGVMRVLRFYSGVTSTKAADVARVGHMLIYVGRDFASSRWVMPVQLFDGPKKREASSEQELLLPPFLAYDFEEEFSIDPSMELPEKQTRMEELEEFWDLRLPENLKHFVLGLLPHLNHSEAGQHVGLIGN
ncbi:Uncharacterized protein SCF082_LOCUS28128 [Durusdinium trenchii]|uniref:Uncharacterized protein n=1 Tax=Durusdinium trenchii TaxID=1381693 RepID=A0ABP0MM53_9DINO